MKRWIHASSNLVEYRIYEVEDGEELNCIATSSDKDEAIEYAMKYAINNNIDTHVVISPFDEDDQETRDYLEYELGGLEPYQVIWESSTEDIHASTDVDTIELNGREFAKTDYYSYVPENGGLCRNVAAGQISEHRRPYRVAGNYNIYIDSFPSAALPYSIYLVADKTTGIVYRLEVVQGVSDERQYIKELVQELKNRS